MKLSTPLLALLMMVSLPAPVVAQDTAVDILSLLESQPGMKQRLGLAKLSAAERAAWNEVLNLLLQAGSLTTTPASPTLPTPSPSPTIPASSISVFETTVDDTSNDVVELSNGAVVEVTGYLGYVGYRRDAVLLREGRSWRLWIEGKRTYSARVLREPSRRGARTGELVSIGEVLANGAMLRLLDGRLLEVNPIDLIYTGLWLGFSEAVLLDGYELINLDNGEKISVISIR